MRSYHNGVFRHHRTYSSSETSPLWVSFVQSTLRCVFLGSHQISKVSTSPKYFPSIVTFPVLQLWFPSCESSFICCQVNLSIILWTKKVWFYHTPPTPIQLFPSPPRIQRVSPQIVSHLSVISLTLLVKETSLPWLGTGLPLSKTTHIFQRIDPKVPVSWFH